MLTQSKSRGEEYMLKWTTGKCKDGARIELNEGWDFISEQGIDVLRSTILGNSFGVQPPSATAFSCLYTVSYKMCSQPMADYSMELYSRYKQSIDNFLRTDIISLLVREQHGSLLRVFCQAWDMHKLMTRWMWRLFMHLDNGFICNKRMSGNSKMKSLTSYSLYSFYEIVFGAVKTHVCNDILQAVENDRKGSGGSLEYVESSVEIFRVMGVASKINDIANLVSALDHPSILTVYTEDLECYLLEESRKYYRNYSSEKCSQASLNVSDYLLNVRVALAEEEARCSTLFSCRTAAKVRRILLHEMITGQQTMIMEGMLPYFEQVFDSLFPVSMLSFGEVTCDVGNVFFDGLANMFTLFVLSIEEEDPEDSDVECVLSDPTELDSRLVMLADGFFRFSKRIGDCMLEKNQVQFHHTGRCVPSMKPLDTPSSYTQQTIIDNTSRCNEVPATPRHGVAPGMAATPSGDLSSALEVAPDIPSASPPYVLSTPLNKRSSTSTSVPPTGSGLSVLPPSTGRMHKQRALATSYTEELMYVITLIDNITQRIFRGHSLFLKAAKKALKLTVNHSSEGFDCMEIYAGYCDSMIRADSTSGLERFMRTVFPIIDSKDIFLDAYTRLLSKRLLLGSSGGGGGNGGQSDVCIDSEKYMVGLMKLQCGTSFAIKVEGMLTDYSLAEDLFQQWIIAENQYRQSLEGGGDGRCVSSTSKSLQIDFRVKVLTSCYWPTLASFSWKLPADMQICVDRFTGWYLASNSSRRLTWTHSAGDVVVRMSYKGDTSSARRVYDASMSIEQAIVLRVFDFDDDNSGGDSRPALSVGNIRDILGLSLEDVKLLKRVLHSLSCTSLKILVKSPSNPKQILDTDTFISNPHFQSKHRKFKMGSVQPQQDSSRSNLDKATEGERGYSVDAAIVRVMKARKVCKHSQLQEEVLRQITSFAPDVRFIKKRISVLIEKDFIERDHKDPSVYIYMP